MAEKKKTQHTSFTRDLGLFDATMIGVGAMIGAGIFVLTGIAAGEAGPASILSFALNGFVTLLTAFAYAELASAIPRAGGGYSFVRMAFPGATGFVSGWMLWFAYTVACSLYALGFAGYFWEFLHKYFPSLTGNIFSIIGQNPALLTVTIVVGLFFIWLNVRGTEVTGKAENILTLSKIVILAIFIFFGILQITEEPARAAESFTPFFPEGLGGVLIAMGLTFIAFEGYDLIATVAEEIKDPEKNIPKATFISLSITVFIYMLILLVSLGAINPEGMMSWEFLGKYQETAIVRAAENFMPAFGVLIIVIGGLLSTMSALNATVMAASRVAFSMGRDVLLPRKMALIHPVRRTPHISIIVTGVILIIMALLLPIEAVGSAASLIFLLTFAMVNLSVIVLRRKYPEIPRKYKVPLYPIVPLLGFTLNIFLALYQFNFQPIAWYFTIGWIAVGLLLYYAVFEKQASDFEPQVLIPVKPNPLEEVKPSIVVALYNPDNIQVLMDVAISISKTNGHRIIPICVVDVPRQMPIHEGMRYRHHKEPLLKKAMKYAQEKKINVETDIVIAHHIYEGILQAAETHKASTLIMGWKGFTDTKDRIFGEVADKVIRYAPCDLVLMKIENDFKFDKILFPTSGGPNAMLAASILQDIDKDFNIEITSTYVVPEEADHEQIDMAVKRIDETMKSISKDMKYKKKLIRSNSIPAGIAKESREFDILAIGAAKEPFFSKMLFGEIPEKVARYSQCSVIVVKKYEGVIKSVFKRIMG
jgi:amino acid transporter/nucleotide-binding universal stress UspA family protein